MDRKENPVNRKKTLALTVIAAALSVVVAACGSSTNGTSAAPTVIRYQQGEGIISPLELASYLGYLGSLRIDSVGTVLGGPADIQAVATGSSDVGGAFNGSIGKALVAGAKIKAVIGYYGSNADSYDGLYVTAKSAIHSARDLIGKTVGVNTLGANATEVIDLWLAKEGLTPAQIKQVDYVVVPPTDADQALREGRLDAVLLSGAGRVLAVHQGGIRLLMTDTGLLGPYTGGSLVLRDDFIQQYPKVAAEVVKGLARAIHWLQTTPSAQVIPVAEKIADQHGRTTDSTWLKYWQSQGVAESGGYIKPADFSTWIKAMTISGQLKPGQISVGQVYTNQFNPYAPSGGA
jgi:ABC-type nitrate/sulfonate/bicarbonate transport system substrate-binding protein